MLAPLAFINPYAYCYFYTCASMRHAAWGMPHHQHRQMMRFWYGI